MSKKIKYTIGAKISSEREISIQSLNLEGYNLIYKCNKCFEENTLLIKPYNSGDRIEKLFVGSTSEISKDDLLKNKLVQISSKRYEYLGEFVIWKLPALYMIASCLNCKSNVIVTFGFGESQPSRESLLISGVWALDNNDKLEDNLKEYHSLENDYGDEINALFIKLIDNEESIVLETLGSLKNINYHDKKLNAFLLNLAYFHPSRKVRSLSKEKLLLFGGEPIINQIDLHWKNNYLKSQEYYRKELYENEFIDPSEYLVFSQAIRRIYFERNKKPPFIMHAKMRYDDEIENVFDVYQVELERISENLIKLQNITVANFNNQKKLNFEEVIDLLANLPELKLLQITKSNLSTLPLNLDKLKNLKRLIVENNPISSLGDYQSNTLEKLEIKSTNIREIDLNKFPNLKEVWVDGQNKKPIFINTNGNLIVTSGKLWSEKI